MVKIELSLKLGSDKEPSRGTDTQRPDGEEPVRRRSRSLLKKLILGLSLLVVIAVGVTLYRHFSKSNTGLSSPFTAKVQSSVQFPLYYPTQLPVGYSLDPKTVTEPKQGVVLFQLNGPGDAVISVSEEARPNSFNLGGFYKQFTGYKSIPVSGGVIATGYVQYGQVQVASRANNQTWVLATTPQRVPQNQLIDMMRSLTVSY